MGPSTVAVASALWLLCACLVHAGSRPPPEATVGGGAVVGFWTETRQGRDIAAFEGIPYAKPPVGELRFEAPQPADPWKGVLHATKPGSICTQRNLYFGEKEVVGDEDCLYINVYTPNDVKQAKPLDVMVFIHGGGWISGAGHLYGPQFILDQDVILVTVNYRLGPLGFLSTGDEVVPGNNGLKDVVAALRWVKENIASFGGNPDSVTIFGESAGGATVQLMMLSPLAKGLFHKAISQSGSALCPWAFSSPGIHRRHSAQVAQFIDCPVAPSDEFVRCLKGKSGADITAVDLTFLEWGLSPMIPFKPTVENGGDSAFIERHPYDILASGDIVSDVPYITGIVAHEGCIGAVGIFQDEKVMEDYDKRFEELTALVMLLKQHPEPLWRETMQKARKFYLGDGPIKKDAVFNIIDMYTDALFAWPAFESVKLHMKKGKSPVYAYEFAHLSTRSFGMLFGANSTEYGVCHADDLIHLFPLQELFPDFKRTVDDEIVSNTFVDYFTTFAKQGKPTGNDFWQRVAHPMEAEYLHIGSPGDINMRANYAPARLSLWDKAPIALGRMPATHDEL